MRTNEVVGSAGESEYQREQGWIGFGMVNVLHRARGIAERREVLCHDEIGAAVVGKARYLAVVDERDAQRCGQEQKDDLKDYDPEHVFTELAPAIGILARSKGPGILRAYGDPARALQRIRSKNSKAIHADGPNMLSQGEVIDSSAVYGGGLSKERIQNMVGHQVVLLLETGVGDTGHDGEMLVRIG